MWVEIINKRLFVGRKYHADFCAYVTDINDSDVLVIKSWTNLGDDSPQKTAKIYDTRSDAVLAATQQFQDFRQDFEVRAEAEKKQFEGSRS